MGRRGEDEKSIRNIFTLRNKIIIEKKRKERKRQQKRHLIRMCVYVCEDRKRERKKEKRKREKRKSEVNKLSHL